MTAVTNKKSDFLIKLPIDGFDKTMKYLQFFEAILALKDLSLVSKSFRAVFGALGRNDYWYVIGRRIADSKYITFKLNIESSRLSVSYYYSIYLERLKACDKKPNPLQIKFIEGE